MTPAPSRRWFRFSLRTLFVVVTVFGCWMGYELNWIRQRHAFIAQEETKLSDRFWAKSQYEPEIARKLSSGRSNGSPDLLWLFGEPGRDVVLNLVAVENQTAPHHAAVLSTESEARIREAKRLFPEAHVAEIREQFWKKSALAQSPDSLTLRQQLP